MLRARQLQFVLHLIVGRRAADQHISLYTRNLSYDFHSDSGGFQRFNICQLKLLELLLLHHVHVKL